MLCFVNIPFSTFCVIFTIPLSLLCWTVFTCENMVLFLGVFIVGKVYCADGGLIIRAHTLTDIHQLNAFLHTARETITESNRLFRHNTHMQNQNTHTYYELFSNLPTRWLMVTNGCRRICDGVILSAPTTFRVSVSKLTKFSRSQWSALRSFSGRSGDTLRCLRIKYKFSLFDFFWKDSAFLFSRREILPSSGHSGC